MTKRKDGRWQEQITIEVRGQKKQKYFYGKTKQEVLKKISAFKEQQRGESFENIADEWWEQHEPDLSPTSIAAYLRAKRRAVEYFSGRDISSIRPVDIERFMDNIATEKHMAKKTAENQLIVVKQIFKFAVRCGCIDNNPARDITVGKKLKKSVRSVPDGGDIAKIKNSLDCTFGLFAYFAMYTGLRKGELLALTWDDIDLDARIISVTKAVYNDHNRPKIKPPKTESGIRRVPVLNRLYDVLTTQKIKKGIVFHKNGEMLKEKEFRTLWDRYRQESGVTCTVHQLRHLYTTMLFENDIAVKDAQKLLGHAQASTTQDIYTHIREERMKQISEKLLDADID